MAGVSLKPAGNQPNTNFFANAIKNRSALVPAAAALASMANKPLGTGSASQYNSLVQASQINGAGPVIPPISSPFSFTQFATGKRVLSMAIKKRIGKK
jgi:hypothetical protein